MWQEDIVAKTGAEEMQVKIEIQVNGSSIMNRNHETWKHIDIKKMMTEEFDVC